MFRIPFAHSRLRTVDDQWNLADLADSNDGINVKVANERHVSEHPRLIHKL